MNVNVLGRVNNTTLYKSQALMPLFEAVFNSMQAIIDTGEENGVIDIYIERDFSLRALALETPENTIYPIKDFKIVDNGIGFDDLNYESFNTSDSMLRANQGNKGIGRFIWLKAFKQINVKSTFVRDGSFFDREFDFELSESGVSGHSTKPSLASKSGTIVSLKEFYPDFRDSSPKNVTIIARKLMEHILVYFVNETVPKITVHDSPEIICLNDLFNEEMKKNVSSGEFLIQDEKFEVKYVKSKSTLDNDHSLHLCAQGRDVKSFKLKKYNTDFTKKLENEDGEQFFLLCYITGDYLEKSVNQERTSFNLPDESDTFFVSTDEIVKNSVKNASDFVKFSIEKVQKSRLESIREYVTTKAPTYRPLLNERYREYLSQIPINTSEDKLEIELHKVFREIEIDVKQRGRLILTQKPMDSVEELDEYRIKYQSFIEEFNEIGKANLAGYIAHRRVIIELFENSLKKQPDGKYLLESSIHKFIHPLISSSDETNLYQQNLWLIDEKLAYHAYLASDKPLKSIDFLDVNSAREPDIICNFFFESALVFSEDKSASQSIVIVEFKRPGREDYRKENPISQVLDYTELIRSGNAKDKDGRPIPSRNVPVYAYIICDLTPDLKKNILQYGFTEMYDGQGFYDYNKNYQCYVEVISFDKMIEDAKRRNRILFEKLNLPPI